MALFHPRRPAAARALTLALGGGLAVTTALAPATPARATDPTPPEIIACAGDAMLLTALLNRVAPDDASGDAEALARDMSNMHYMLMLIHGENTDCAMDRDARRTAVAEAAESRMEELRTRVGEGETVAAVLNGYREEVMACAQAIGQPRFEALVERIAAEDLPCGPP
jgi:hypothetical protein